MPEYCQEYTGADDPCKVNCPLTNIKVYHARITATLAGTTVCSEAAMMKGSVAGLS